MLTYSHVNNRYERTFTPMQAEDFKAFALQVLKQWRRTGETADEYRKKPPAEQLHIKDTGGFVAGTFAGNKRGKNNVERRFALTLDIDGDKPSMNQLETLRLIYPCALFWYTTHKSTPEEPRYRIVCELSRTVTAVEYTQLSRNLCASLRLEVDPSTHQADRLMFYPSTSADGDMRGKYEEGAPLDVEQLLALAPPEAILPQELADDKQTDPRTKSGAVGAFCRVYSIDRAIRELVPGFYIPCGEGRYTYKDSTTAGGAVVMEGGAFLYSFHGSDPNANKLMNAFDLVRLLKFGHLDGDTKKTGAALPSYKAMEAYALDLSEVAEELHRAAVAELPDDGEWVKELEIRKSGDLKGSIANYELILRNDPRLKGAVKLNEFAHRLEVVRPLPWRSHAGEWTDSDDAGLRGYTERHYKEVNRGNLSDALVNVYEENRYHPVRDYLDGLKWDGVGRLDTLLVDYMGAEDSPYVRAVTRKALAAAVARIYRPGVKFDYVLTLVGREGVGKSSLFARLGGAWFSDTFLSVSGKEAVEQLQGVWIMEIGELAGLKKAEVEAIKAYISSQEDRVRLAYAKRTATFPRECVFVATTNNPSFLRSANGNRRFWPVEVGKGEARRSLWEGLDDATVGQIWAEAKAAYRAREPLYLKGAEAEEALRRQESHQEGDEWESLIREYLDKPVPADWNKKTLPQLAAYYQTGGGAGGEDDPFAAAARTVGREAVCPRQIWNECFGRPVHELDAQKVRRINAILNDLPGWTRSDTPRKFGPYGLNRCHVREDRKE